MTPAIVGGIGPLELGIILLIVLVIFGGRRLPTLGRQLGSGMREFKDSVTRKVDADDESGPQAALGRPAGEDAPVDGEIVRERR